MSRSQVLDTSAHGYQMLFRDAVVAVGRATRRKWGANAELALLSHALSDIDEAGRWHVVDIGGNPIALVAASGRAELIDVTEVEE